MNWCIYTKWLVACECVSIFTKIDREIFGTVHKTITNLSPIRPFVHLHRSECISDRNRGSPTFFSATVEIAWIRGSEHFRSEGTLRGRLVRTSRTPDRNCPSWSKIPKVAKSRLKLVRLRPLVCMLATETPFHEMLRVRWSLVELYLECYLNAIYQENEVCFFPYFCCTKEATSIENYEKKPNYKRKRKKL